MRLKGDRGSATAISVGIFSAIAVLVGLTSVSSELAIQQIKLQVLADTIAIAASDAYRGLISGLPCESAKDLAESSFAQLRSCSIVGQSVHISLTVKTLGIVLSAEAIAEELR